MTHRRGSLGVVDDLNLAKASSHHHSLGGRGKCGRQRTLTIQYLGHDKTRTTPFVHFTIQNFKFSPICRPKTPVQISNTAQRSRRWLLANQALAAVLGGTLLGNIAIADENKPYRAPIESRLVGVNASVHMQYQFTGKSDSPQPEAQADPDIQRPPQPAGAAGQDAELTASDESVVESLDESRKAEEQKMVSDAESAHSTNQFAPSTDMNTQLPDPYNAKIATLPAPTQAKSEPSPNPKETVIPTDAKREIESKAIVTKPMRPDVQSLYGASLIGSETWATRQTEDRDRHNDTTASNLWDSVTVDPGDTLVSVFLRAGIDPAYAVRIAEYDRHSTLRRLRAGQSIDLKKTGDGGFRAMRYTVSPDRQFEARYHEGVGIVVEDSDLIRQIGDENEYEAFGFIQSSLYEAATDIGLHPALIADFAKIFRYEIDFSMDLRRGDRFAVIYEDAGNGVEKAKGGDILAAEFINNGERHRAIRYVDEDGNTNFYTPEGYSLRRAFFRSPVEFTRITSSFSNRRFHPVLKLWKAHRGVDYAAAIGTPVLATADGVISHRAAMGGYGRTVTIRHNESYETLYAHLSDYKRGQRIGDTVLQGDIIGYVGRSGNATGPHLHYEFRVNGRHRDPLTVISDQAPAERIADNLLPDFLDTVSVYSSKLDSLDAKIAQNRVETGDPDQS